MVFCLCKLKSITMTHLGLSLQFSHIKNPYLFKPFYEYCAEPWGQHPTSPCHPFNRAVGPLLSLGLPLQLEAFCTFSYNFNAFQLCSALLVARAKSTILLMIWWIRPEVSKIELCFQDSRAVYSSTSGCAVVVEQSTFFAFSGRASNPSKRLRAANKLESFWVFFFSSSQQSSGLTLNIQIFHYVKSLIFSWSQSSLSEIDGVSLPGDL